MPSLLLITPENEEIKRFRANQFNNFTQLTMPYLAGFVPKDFTIRLVDEYNENLPFEKFDLVAITVNTPNAPHVYDIAGQYRKLGSWVVLGGPHVTLLPEEAALEADTVFIGEAEETWPQFLADFLKGKPEKAYKSIRPPSLAGLPVPRRDLIKGHRLTSGAVFATRGCPHNCSYCSLKKIYHPEFRVRPVAEVIEEIKHIPNQYFVFWDDNFFADKDYAAALLKALAPLNKKWAAQVTIHSCKDETLLTLARRAGCIYLFLGLESFSKEGLQDANKAFNPVENYAQIIKRIHKHKISVQAGVVFGFDSDHGRVFDDALNICEEIGIDGVTTSILTPFPGTQLYHHFQQQNRLLPVDWSYFNGKTRVAFQPQNMSVEALLHGYHGFRGRFFSWKSIIKRLCKSRVNFVYNLVMNLGYRRSYIKFTSKNKYK